MLAGSWQYWSPIGKSLEIPEAESDNIKMISRDNDIYKYSWKHCSQCITEYIKYKSNWMSFLDADIFVVTLIKNEYV